MDDTICPSCSRNFGRSGGLTNHLKSCEAHKKELRKAQANISKSKARAGAKPSLPRWAAQLDIDDDGFLDETLDSSPSVHVASPSNLAQPGTHGDTPVPSPAISREPTPIPAPPEGRILCPRKHTLQKMRDAVVGGQRLPLIPPPTVPPAPDSTPPLQAFPNNSGSTTFDTKKNPFGIYKRYNHYDPQYMDPDGFVDGQELLETNIATILDAHSEGTDRTFVSSLFSSPSALRLGDWYWGGSPEKSVRSFQDLLKIVSSEDFQPEDIRNTNWRKVYKALGVSYEHKNHGSDNDSDDPGSWFTETSWTQQKVFIDISFDADTAVPGAHRYTIKSFFHRPLVDVIKEKLSSLETQERFHLLPYELRWQRSQGRPSTRLHREIYASPAFSDAHEKVQELPPEPDCKRPRHVFAIMFSSDKSQLAQFGTAAVWPLYFFSGNESKYDRCKPSLKMGEQIAYFEELPDSLKDWILERAGDSWPKYRLAPLLTHCRRELFHAQWKVLLDSNFLEAYQHGIAVMWMDGVERRFYPRIFTYSADYPEKATIATIRQMGTCACPRCLIPLNDVHNMGKDQDTKRRLNLARSDNVTWRYNVRKAREAIFQEHKSIVSASVHSTLEKDSLVPTENVFATLLGPFGFDVFTIFASDILHEFELGVWKATFLHLMRILQVAKVKHAFDERFRQIPSFGSDTIRRFSNNVSETKQLAARDYEDLLQCAIPAFEGLLESPHNKAVLDMLFSLAHWHGLAKLRLHSDETLAILDQWTKQLGRDVRRFERTTCKAFGTVELDKEYAARQRRNARKQTSKVSQDKGKGPAKVHQAGASSASSGGTPLTIRIPPLNAANPEASAPEGSKSQGKRKEAASVLESDSQSLKKKKKKQSKKHYQGKSPERCSNPAAVESRVLDTHSGPDTVPGKLSKSLSLSTYTYHALGDTQRCISLFGTTDSYSTQIGELYHRFPKSSYRRTNRKQVNKQLAKNQMRQKRLARLRKLLLPDDAEGVPPPAASQRYFIGKSQHRPVYLSRFMDTHRNDPAAQGFVSKLKEHILERIEDQKRQDPTVLSAEQPKGPKPRVPTLNGANQILIQGQRIFEHKLLYINYTTYDIRQEQDIINPSTDRRDIMLICARHPDEQADSHRFLYGRVLGIFHANVMQTSTGDVSDHWSRFDFLWVRWFQTVQAETVWLSKRLDTLTFAPIKESQSFGFVDPSEVLRACHIIPRFSKGPARQSHGVKSAYAQSHSDWAQYFVNRFADRDMVMRFHWGLAVGHLYTYQEADVPEVTADQSEEPATRLQIPAHQDSTLSRSTSFLDVESGDEEFDEVDQAAEAVGLFQGEDSAGLFDGGDRGVGDDRLDIVHTAEAELDRYQDDSSEDEDPPEFLRDNQSYSDEEADDP